MASSSLLAQILRLTTAFYQCMASSALWARKRYPDVADGVGGVAAVVEGAVGVGVREAQALALRGRERAQVADGLSKRRCLDGRFSLFRWTVFAVEMDGFRCLDGRFSRPGRRWPVQNAALSLIT